MLQDSPGRYVDRHTTIVFGARCIRCASYQEAPRDGRVLAALRHWCTAVTDPQQS
jgi:hypothetical protein